MKVILGQREIEQNYMPLHPYEIKILMYFMSKTSSKGNLEISGWEVSRACRIAYKTTQTYMKKLEDRGIVSISETTFGPTAKRKVTILPGMIQGVTEV